MLNKVLLASVALFFSCVSGKAQTLTFEQLISLGNNNLSRINSTLLAKGWVFKGESTNNRSSNGCSSPEVYWVHYSAGKKPQLKYFDGPRCRNVIEYQTTDLIAFSNIKAGLQKYKLQNFESKGSSVRRTLDGEHTGITEAYQSYNYLVSFTTTSSKPSSGKSKNYFLVMIEVL
jgi:hypothetical protein